MIRDFERGEIEAAGDGARRREMISAGGRIWGLPMGLITAVIYTAQRPDFSLYSFTSPRFLFRCLVFLPLFYVLGCLMGWVLHRLFYHKG